MKTILHVIDTTGPGGAETIFIDLASRLPVDSYRPVVLIRGKGWVYEELQRRGIKPVIMDAKGSFNWRFLRSLVALIRREKVDLIQSHLLGSNVYCSLAGLLARTPVVATFHGAVDFLGKSRLTRLKYGAINAGAGAIVAVSESLRQEILENTSLSPGKLRLVYNGIDTSVYHRPRSNTLKDKFGWGKEVFIVGSLGNVRPAKGYDVLLRAAALIAEQHAHVRFVIAGQGNTGLYDELLKLQAELGLEEVVQFLGYIDDPAEFLSGIDLFLSSSISEGMPLSAIQAMVAKLPVLATRCGGYQELVTDGVNGRLVEVGSPEAIARGLTGLLHDGTMRTSLASGARQHALSTFDMEVMLQAYQAIYSELMS
jgi:glycosyltransferase involved in cell wall biosynthesis